MALVGRRDLLLKRLEEIDSLVKNSDADNDTERTSAHLSSTASPGSVSVVTGTSDLAAKHPNLADHLTKIIGDAYGAAGAGYPRLLQEQPVAERLKMGDGSDATGDGVLNTNRVLHVAFVGDNPVGCLSSSFTTTWVSGVGHWGLLVVEPSMQGKGIASSLVAAAEYRLAERCDTIQLEYDFIPGNEHSKRLATMYSRWGYQQIWQFPMPEGGEFRIIRKSISEVQQREGQQRRLQAERTQVMNLLSQLQVSQPTAEVLPMRSKDFFGALSAFVKANGTEVSKDIQKVFQLVVTDAKGPEGKFVVDLKSETQSARTGEDNNADIFIEMSDKDMVAWWKKSLDWKYAFWCGQVAMRGPDPTGGPETFWAAYVAKLTDCFDAVCEPVHGSIWTATRTRCGLLTNLFPGTLAVSVLLVGILWSAFRIKCSFKWTSFFSKWF